MNWDWADSGISIEKIKYSSIIRNESDIIPMAAAQVSMNTRVSQNSVFITA